MLPARKSILTSLADAGGVRPDIALTAQLAMESDTVLSIFVPRTLAVPYGAFFTAVQRVMNGEVDAEQALMEAGASFLQPPP